MSDFESKALFGIHLLISTWVSIRCKTPEALSGQQTAGAEFISSPWWFLFLLCLLAPRDLCQGRHYRDVEKYLGTVGLECLYVYLTVDCHLIVCCSIFFFQIFEEKYLVLDFCFRNPGKKTCGRYFLTAFLTFTEENWEGNLHFKL